MMSVGQRTYKKRFLGSKQGLLFLVFAAILWTLSALSETYTTTIPVELKLQDNTDSFVLLASKIDVPARVSSSGFSVLYRKIFPRKIQLSINELPIKDAQNPVISAVYLLDKYNETYSNPNDIKGFVPATVLLPVVQAIQKSFAPILAALPLLEPGFQYVTPLTFSVDSITAFGSKEVLDQLEQAVFELPSKKPLRADFLLEATLIDSIAQVANWSTTRIQVSGAVDRYSDVSFVLPVKLSNVPSDMHIALAPKQVEIKFAVPLGLLRSLDASMLRAVAVFEQTSSGQLPIEVMGLPDTVKKLAISPPAISYFIVE